MNLVICIKMESSRKLSNFLFSVDKNPCSRKISIIAFFLTLFEGYKCIKLYEITPKKTVVMGAGKNKLQKFQIS